MTATTGIASNAPPAAKSMSAFNQSEIMSQLQKADSFFKKGGVNKRESTNYHMQERQRS